MTIAYLRHYVAPDDADHPLMAIINDYKDQKSVFDAKVERLQKKYGSKIRGYVHVKKLLEGLEVDKEFTPPRGLEIMENDGRYYLTYKKCDAAGEDFRQDLHKIEVPHIDEIATRHTNISPLFDHITGTEFFIECVGNEKNGFVFSFPVNYETFKETREKLPFDTITEIQYLEHRQKMEK